MKSQASGRKVLHFAVTGALLGGGATGCAAKHEHGPNVAPVEEPGPASNPGPVDAPEEPHTNVGPADHPDTPTHVNTAPVDPPDAEPDDKPPIAVNPAPQPEPSK